MYWGRRDYLRRSIQLKCDAAPRAADLGLGLIAWRSMRLCAECGRVSNTSVWREIQVVAIGVFGRVRAREIVPKRVWRSTRSYPKCTPQETGAGYRPPWVHIRFHGEFHGNTHSLMKQLNNTNRKPESPNRPEWTTKLSRKSDDSTSQLDNLRRLARGCLSCAVAPPISSDWNAVRSVISDSGAAGELDVSLPDGTLSRYSCDSNKFCVFYKPVTHRAAG